MPNYRKSKAKGIYDPPSIYKDIKTTIKNGMIVRTDIWKDTVGNELKKTGTDEFKIVKRASPSHYDAGPIMFSFDPNGFNGGNGHSPEEDFIFMLTFVAICALCIGYFLGYFVSKMKYSKQLSIQKIPNEKIPIVEVSSERIST